MEKSIGNPYDQRGANNPLEKKSPEVSISQNIHRYIFIDRYISFLCCQLAPRLSSGS